MNKTLTQPKKIDLYMVLFQFKEPKKYKQLNTKNILVLIIAFTIYFQVVNCHPYWTEVSDTDTQQGISSQKFISDNNIFTKSAPRPIQYISRNVRMCVCVYVTLCSLHLNLFLHPFPKVQSLNFLKIQNTWEKIMERSGLIFEHCCLEMI